MTIVDGRGVTAIDPAVADVRPAVAAPAIVVHGHFYQPAREDPFTGLVPLDPGAAPAHDWNERIADEAYASNAAHDNFRRMSWNLGPTLAVWLRRERPALHDSIIAQADHHNTLAQGYHHTILPLASARDRRTEIRWAVRDMELRTGSRPTGLWLPETAVDLLTLRIAAQEGIGWTMLAPWQGTTSASAPVDPRIPYQVELGDGLRMTVVFYDAGLSAAVSFDPHTTSDADRFVDELLVRDMRAGTAVIATDGELYGHHHRFRDLFLARLLAAAPGRGLSVTSIGAWLDALGTETLEQVQVSERTSWSCHHGIARWIAECACAHDGRWKGPLRQALDRLAAAIDMSSEVLVAGLGVDVWAARDRYVDVASDYADAHAWAAGELRAVGRSGRKRERRLLLAVMRAQTSRLAMFASDAWFWGDPQRIETWQALRFAAHAARILDDGYGSALERDLIEDLVAVRCPGGAVDGAALYRIALDGIGQPIRG